MKTFLFPLLNCLLLLFCFSSNIKAQRIVFMPQWTLQSQFAGYYVAQEKGFYREAGLDVEIIHPSASNTALNHLREGSCDVTTLQLAQAMVLVDEGLSLKNILQTSQRNSLMIVPRRDDIRTLEDLKGKKVGIWNAGFGELARILDEKEQLNIEWIPFINNVNLFVSGAIDATLAMGYNEYFQILACGIEPAHVFLFEDLGFDIPEDGLYVTSSYYQSHRQELKAFVEASVRGWRWTAEHPEEALDIVLKYARDNQVVTNRVQQKRMLETILKLQCRKGEKTASFRLDSAQVKNTSRLLLQYGRIKQEVTCQELSGSL